MLWRACLLFVLVVVAGSFGARSLVPKPVIVGHRGAPVYVPEHSISSYAIAIREGVDFIEPDLSITKDGHYVCLHDPELSVMTDVADHPEFADRYTTVTFPSGVKVSGWLVNNFTLAEIKVLRLKQRVATRDQIYNGLFNVTTLQEAIEALQSRNALYNTSVGIYIEPKHPTYFAQYGLTFDSVFDILESYGYALKGQAAKDANIYLECFETTWLKAAAEKTDMKLIFLVEAPTKPCEDTLKPYGEYMTKAGFDELSQFVFGLGPLKRYLYPFDTQFMSTVAPGVLTGNDFVAEAHARNLYLHPWTVRNALEDAGVDLYFNGHEYDEYRYLLELGVDGVFTESAGIAIAARNDFVMAQDRPRSITVALSVVITICVAVGTLAIGAFAATAFWRLRHKSVDYAAM